MRYRFLWLAILAKFLLLSHVPTTLAQQDMICQIAFVSDRDGNSEIYLINADGSSLTNLTNHPAKDSEPSWSPDGSLLAFVSDRSGTSSIYVMNADGSDVRQITDMPIGSENPVWSPDGNRIAFRDQGFRSREDSAVYWINKDGSGLTRLYGGPAFGSQISWSLDSQQLVFDFLDGDFKLFISNLNGEATQYVVRSSEWDRPTSPSKGWWDMTPAWSPNGQHIAFGSTRFSGANDVYVADLDGNNVVNLSASLSYSYAPIWSPDSQWVAFMSVEGLHIARSDGSVLTKLSDLAGVGGKAEWSWSSDSDYLSFAAPAGDAKDIYVIAADGSGLVNLTNNPTQDSSPVWRPAPPPTPAEGLIAYFDDQDHIRLINSDVSGEKLITDDGHATYNIADMELKWSPNGRFLAFVRRDFTGNTGQESLVIYDVESSSLQSIITETNINGFDWALDSASIVFSPPFPTGWSPGQEMPGLAPGLQQVNLATGQVEEIVAAERDVPIIMPQWSYDGHYLSFEEAVSEGHGILVVYDMEAKRYPNAYQVLGDHDWAPDSNLLAYDKVQYFPGPGTQIWIVDSIGAATFNLTPTRTTSGDVMPKFSPTGEQIAFLRLPSNRTMGAMGPLWLVPADAYYGDGSRERQLTTFDVNQMSWSPDGQHLVASTGNYPGDEIFIVGISKGDTQWLARGHSPAWQPVSYATEVIDIDLESWLEEKQTLITQLETVDIPTSLFTVPAIAAFDEGAAQALYDTIVAKVDEGTLRADEAEAFTRLTLQERAIAEMLPAYTTVTATLADTSVDSVETALGLLLILEPAWDKCKDLFPFCGRLQQRTERLVWRLITDAGRNVANLFADDPEQQQTFANLWDLIIGSIEAAFAEGQSLLELLIRNAIEAGFTSIVVDLYYIGPTQQLLDMGVSSADIAGDNDARWPVEGTTQRAELLIDSYVEQAKIEEELAYGRYLDFRSASDIIKLAEDIADAAALSPLSLMAEAVSLGARLEHIFLINLPLTFANIGNLKCIGYLSQEAAEAAFDGDRPFESCRDRNEASLSQRMSVYNERPATRWTATHEGTRYRKALISLQSALDSGKMMEIQQALDELIEAEAAVTWELDRALAVTEVQAPLTEDLLPLLEVNSAFSAANIALYFSVAHTLMAQQEGQEPEVDITETVQSVEAHLQEVEQLMTTIELSPPETPLIVLRDVEVIAVNFDETQLGVVMHNVGASNADEIRIVAVSANQVAVAEEILGSLPGGGETTITINIPTGEHKTPLMIQVWSQGVMMDALWDVIEESVVGPSSLSVEEEIVGESPPVTGGDIVPLATAESGVEGDTAEDNASEWQKLTGDWIFVVIISLSGLAIVLGSGLWLWRRGKSA